MSSNGLPWLRATLEETAGLSQRGLAQHLGKSAAAINRMLAGGRRVQLDEITAIAEYISVTPEELAERLGVTAANASPGRAGGTVEINLRHRVTFDQAQRIFAILNEGGK